jgi:hypothetical protein
VIQILFDPVLAPGLSKDQTFVQFGADWNKNDPKPMKIIHAFTHSTNLDEESGNRNVFCTYPSTGPKTLPGVP